MYMMVMSSTLHPVQLIFIMCHVLLVLFWRPIFTQDLAGQPPDQLVPQCPSREKWTGWGQRFPGRVSSLFFCTFSGGL